MKILFVTRDIKDGIGTTVKNLVWQYEQMPEVELITVVAPGQFEVKTGKVRFLIAGIIGRYFFTKEPYFAYQATKVIESELAKNSYDIIHTHSNILKYKYESNPKPVPVVSTFQVSHQALSELKVPVISTIHNTHSGSVNRLSAGQLKYDWGKYLHLPFTLLDKSRIRNSELITCVSTHTINDLLETMNSEISRDKFVYIPNGVNTSVYKTLQFDRRKFLREKYGIELGNERLLLYIGRLESGKGVYDLATAVSKLDNVLLLMAGAGVEKPQLEKLPFVKCLGFIADETEKNMLLNCADVFTFASLYENFPSVIVEAMAAHKPIVSTKVGMIPEILGNRDAALVDVSDADALAAKIDRMLADNKLAELEAQLNYDYVSKYLDWTSIAKQYLVYYKKLINTNHG